MSPEKTGFRKNLSPKKTAFTIVQNMNAIELLQILQGEFFQKLKKMNGLIQRQILFPDAPKAIKVAIGMRRTGKTTFLYQKINELVASGIEQNSILYLNCEDDRLQPMNAQSLSSIIDAFYVLYPDNFNRKCHLFLDEIQSVEGWSTIVRRLHDTKEVELYLTGSSAKLLSKEIATSLRGRSLAIEIWPFSFREFLKTQPIAEKSKYFDAKRRAELMRSFENYLSDGGFPGVVGLKEVEKHQTLQEYLQVALYRDIAERHQVHNLVALKATIQLMLHNVARPFSISKLHNTLKDQGISLSRETLHEYASYIEDAYLAFSVPLFSHSVHKTQTNPKKLYGIDSGLVRSITLDYERDLGRLFENIVYLDLRRQGYTVSYYLTQERYEVDFLAETARGEKHLFQVAWDIENEDTKLREMRALEAAKNELKIAGELITLETYLATHKNFA